MAIEYNIHEILNRFDACFKHKRISVTANILYNNTISLEVLYEKNRPLDDTNTTKEWTYKKPFNKEPRKTADHYAILALHPTRTTTVSKAQPWSLVFDLDYLYINPYTCPDVNMMQEFEKAKKLFAQQFKQTYHIRLSDKLLQQARNCIKPALKSRYESILEYSDVKNKNKFNKTDFLTFLNTYLDDMRTTLNTIQFLQLGPYGCGDKELDQYFLNSTYMAYQIDNPYFAEYCNYNLKKDDKH